MRFKRNAVKRIGTNKIKTMDRSIANVLSSGSHGNCEIYFNSIAVDMGINFKKIEPYVNQLQLVLLSHFHADHFNKKTISKLTSKRPTLKFGMCEHMLEQIKNLGIKEQNIDVYEIGQFYDYGPFKISPIKLYHDVVNVGYRIIKNNYKIIRATDTAHLNGVEAKDYDLFAIEHNWNEDTIEESIERKKAKGLFVYEHGAMNTHLSEQQAREFIYNNRKESSEVIRLHESK